MITCTNCHQTNRLGAFFCKHCGQTLACPRCRMIQPEPADYCDNCGQALSADKFFTVPAVTHTQQSAPGETVSEPISPTPTFLSTGSPAPTSPSDPSSPSYLGQFIPPELMAKLETARHRGTMTGERRVVTVLFCDVKGSTAAAEQLDPEEWTEIINGAFEHMIKPVYKYEGTVARLMGDGIMVFFGAPIAHEDDPQRAVLAGLDIVASIKPYREKVKQRHNIDFDVRLGINTGMVVVGAVGSDLRMEYTAMGDAVNLAARMEQTALPGTVQIADETYRLVASLFEFEALGSIDLKGKAEPVPAYRVLERKASSGQLRRISANAHPLVGREKAQEHLSAAMEQVLQGSGQIVCIVGEVGLGKSRLVAELRREWDSVLSTRSKETTPDQTLPLPQDMARWYETFCLSYETTRPYGLFQNYLRQVFGAAQGDPPAVLGQKLAAFISATAPANQQNQFRTVLETLFGLRQDGDASLEGETFKEQLFETVTALVSQWVSQSPGVIVCDDIHWADPASVDLLAHLFSLSDRLPILFVCALRPNRRSPGWQITAKADEAFHHRYTEIQLEPLSQEDSHELVRRLLANEDLPQALQDNVLTKTAGNPFFIEEVVRELIESGMVIPGQNGEGWLPSPDFATKPIDIPDSLQSLLMARIDRLDESQRRTLQLAASIGRSFYYRVLKLTAQATGEDQDSPSGEPNGNLDQHLGELQRLELIAQVARLPELEFIFRQALVQESAYKTILRKQRRQYHLKVGQAIETVFPEQLADHAIVLAHHFSKGGDHAGALKYHTLAADTAFRLYANAEAVEHYSQALLAAQETAVTTGHLIDLYTKRGRALELDARYQEALENYETMRQGQDKELQLAALMAMATLYANPTPLYDLELGESLCQEALQLSQELNNRQAEAKIRWNLLNLHWFSGRNQEALEHGQRSLAIARDLNLSEQIAYTLNDLSHVYNRTGQYDKSIMALLETNDLWRELGNLPMLTDSLSSISFAYAFTGDYDKAIAFHQEALQTSESIQNIWGLSFSRFAIGLVYWDLGQPEQAMRLMQDSIHFAKKAGFMVAQVYTRANLALIWAELGDFSAAFVTVQEAIAFAEDGHPQLLPYGLRHIAQLHQMTGNLLAAEEAIEAMRSEEFALHLGQPDLITLVECQLPLYQGQTDEAIRLLNQRMADLREFNMVAYLPETNLILGKGLKTAGLLPQAASALEEGLAQARSVGIKWMEWQLQKALAGLTEGERATALLAEARQTVQFIAGNIGDSDLRQSFLNRPDVKKLMVLEETTRA